MNKIALSQFFSEQIILMPSIKVYCRNWEYLSVIYIATIYLAAVEIEGCL